MTSVYAGIFDDVLWRPPLGKSYETRLHGRDISAESMLQQILLTTALTGVRLVVNDGYLLNLPAARAQLLDKDSALVTLIKNGQLQVLSRNYAAGGDDGIHGMPELMAEQGIVSFHKMVEKRPEFELLKKKLHSVHESLVELKGYRKWPNYDLGEGFCQLVGKISQYNLSSLGLTGRTHPFFEKVCMAFEERIAKDGYGAARTKWETCVNGVTKRATKDKEIDSNDAFIIRSELMQLACEVYHFNFSGCMRKEAGDSGRIGVTTRTSGAFDDLLLGRDASETDAHVHEEDIPIPLFRDSGYKAVFGDPKFFPKLFDQKTEIYHKRKSYCDELNAYLDGRGKRETLQKAEKEFVNQTVTSLMPRGTKEKVSEGGTALVTMLTFGHLVAEEVVNVALGPVAGLAVFGAGRIPYFLKKRQLGRMKTTSMDMMHQFSEVPIVNSVLLKSVCDKMEISKFSE